MANYTTIDSIIDLSDTEKISAVDIPMTTTTNDPKYDLSGMVVGVTKAPYNPVYKFTATEGETISVIDQSFFDPYLRLYDSSGNAIQISSESVDRVAEVYFYDLTHPSDGGSYSLDLILEWVAPYTGTYYVKPGWDQGNYFKNYALSISGDMDTAVKPPPPPPPSPPPKEIPPDIERVFNWAENTYHNLFPEHNESRDFFGYHARMYSNGDGIGEKDGGIYYYDGGNGGSGEIVNVGTVSDYINQAITACF